MATLRVFRDGELLRDYELTEGRTRLGRGVENELVLEDREKRISRTHAEIRYDRGRYVIADLNSQNGVWVGDRQITSEPLAADVPVTIGPYEVVLLPEVAPPPVAAVPSSDASTDEVVIEPTQIADAVAEPPPARTQTIKPSPPPAPAASQTIKKPAPAQRRSPLIPILAGVAAIVLALVVVFALRPGPGQVVDQQAVSTSTVPPTTTTTTVPGPTTTPEQQFQEKYDRAQELIKQGNKAEAQVANDEAVALLPSDPRGLKQREEIQAMTVPPVPGAPGAEGPKPAPPLAETLRVAPRAGESDKDRGDRQRRARTHLDDAKRALDNGQYDSAIALSGAAINEAGRPDFGSTANEARDVGAKAKSAKADAETRQRRASARKLMDDAMVMGTSDILALVEKVRQAKRIDPGVEGADELLNGLQPQARSEGERALVVAKNADNARRPDVALREYERAVQLLELLPEGHKDLDFARQRITALKGK